MPPESISGYLGRPAILLAVSVDVHLPAATDLRDLKRPDQERGPARGRALNFAGKARLLPIISIIGSYESDNQMQISSILVPAKHRSSEAGRRFPQVKSIEDLAVKINELRRRNGTVTRLRVRVRAASDIHHGVAACLGRSLFGIRCCPSTPINITITE